MSMPTGKFWWCLTHHRVEEIGHACPAKDRLGPYPTAEAAERALDKVAERNREWDAEDEAWENGTA